MSRIKFYKGRLGISIEFYPVTVMNHIISIGYDIHLVLHHTMKT